MKAFEVDETQPLLPASRKKENRRSPLALAACLAAVVGAAALFFDPRRSESALDTTADVTLDTSNSWETKQGRKIFDGRIENLVQVHTVTSLRLSSGALAVWTVELPGTKEDQGPPAANLTPQGAAAEAEFTFERVGVHRVVATEVKADGVTLGRKHAFAVSAKVVRYDLRDLSTADREAYFAALRTYTVTSPAEGAALYGAGYKSQFDLVRVHLYGAADKECDHWHDDAGILTHHVGITWAFENSLRMINPATAAHYWDYTREDTEGLAWYESPVFDDQWFGASSPSNADHIVDTGRFAYTPVMAHAREFSSITNPYGLLKSPWNTSPVPYLVRHNRTFFDFADGNTAFPSCADFAGYMGSTFAEVSTAVDGVLHGPVHIMIGGHWGAKHDWSALGKNFGASEAFLLLSKDMYRQGWVRVPESCTADTPHSACEPHCPNSILNPDGTPMTSERAHDILAKVNVYALTPGTETDEATDYWATFFGEYGNGTLDFAALLEELCSIGTPGDMLTSAAPQDPLFWPVHGNSERFVQYLRVLKAQGVLDFNETWGYTFTQNAPGNTARVCDWSGVGDPPDMPKCSFGTCPGHKEDDLLPFTHLYDGQGDTLLSNAELYAYVSPFNQDLPYVYDSLSTWKGCPDDSLLAEWELLKAPTPGPVPVPAPPVPAPPVPPVPVPPAPAPPVGGPPVPAPPV